MITTLAEAAELIEEADRPALGIQFDTWHVWNTPDLVEEIERYAHLFVGVHIADWRKPTRSWADRVLPGDGVAGLPAIFGALERAGWAGYYDLEIFSDNGTFGKCVARFSVGAACRAARSGRPRCVRARVGGANPNLG
jgi:sugar phosphate isomerase/epimerase